MRMTKLETKLYVDYSCVHLGPADMGTVLRGVGYGRVH